MTTHPTFRYTMQGLLRDPDRLTSVEREWLARYDAGQPCELWAVAGGEDEAQGFTVLWCPKERVAWAGNYGLEFLWYASVDHPRDFETFFTDPAKTLRPTNRVKIIFTPVDNSSDRFNRSKTFNINADIVWMGSTALSIYVTEILARTAGPSPMSRCLRGAETAGPG